MMKMMIFVIGVALAALCSCPSAAEAASFNVTSDLVDSQPFVLTCWSGDNQLGQHVLYFRQSVYFHFSGMPWTKFWCEFEWRALHLQQQTWGFNIVARTPDFLWFVTVKGLFMQAYLPGGDREFFQPWQTGVIDSNASQAGGSGSYNKTVEAAPLSAP